jgi:hypothetical protein
MMSDILPVQLALTVDNAVISIPSTLSLWVTLLCLFYAWEVTTGRFGIDLRQGSVGRKQDLSTTWNSRTLHPSALNCQQKIVRPMPLKGPAAQRLKATQASGPFLFVANNSWPPQWTIFATSFDANDGRVRSPSNSREKPFATIRAFHLTKVDFAMRYIVRVIGAP